MIFYQISTDGDRNFGYIVGCEKTKEAMVVDPSPNPQPVFEKVEELGLNIKYIVNTHDHYDHNGGNEFFKNKTNGKIVQHSNGKNGEIKVNDKDTLKFGDVEVEILHTPGHTNCSICLLAEDNLLTGDTLFVGKVGGTSGEVNGKEEFDSLNKIMKLGPNTKVWPGHDVGVQPHSTIDFELNNNPFVTRLGNFNDFMWLKNNWADYKIKHNIK